MQKGVQRIYVSTAVKYTTPVLHQSSWAKLVPVCIFQGSLRRKGILNSGEVLTYYLVKLGLLREAGCICIHGAGCDSSKDGEGVCPWNCKVYVYNW